MSDSVKNIWAPWRMEYLKTLGERREGCFLCDSRDEPERDRENLVLWRGEHGFCILNRFPYTGGHLLIAPYAHVPDLDALSPAAMVELLELARDAQAALREAISPDGFNIGWNIGECAGAGLPGHLHLHVVPRWVGDTNVVPILGGVRVIPEFLDTTWEKFRDAGQALNLPALSGAGQ
jgi:ATP adenylyltransferase